MFFLQIVLWFKLWHLYDTINAFFRYDCIVYTYFNISLYVYKSFFLSLKSVPCCGHSIACYWIIFGWIYPTVSISTVKPTRYTSLSNLFHVVVHVSESLSIHHQECKTVHTASGLCQTDYADCLLAGTRWNI